METHPMEPFLPDGARLLMMGSFPPPAARWSMEFYYPNFQNDMWRIIGHVFFNDKAHFVREKTFDKEGIKAFCQEKGIALYDTAHRVIREKETHLINICVYWSRWIWQGSFPAFQRVPTWP